MSDILDRELRDLFANGPRTAPAAVVDGAISQASTVAQRRPRFTRLDRRAWPPLPRSIADPSFLRAARLLAVALVLVVIAVVVAVGARLLNQPPRVTLERAGGVGFDLGSSALVLPDGRVLIQGSGDTAIAFDPRTGATSPIFLGHGFGIYGARLLPDGRVVVVGSDQRQPPDLTRVTVGILDPATGVVTLTGEIPEEAFAPATAVLPDGRVLISGGIVFPQDTYPCNPLVCEGPPTPQPQPTAPGPWEHATIEAFDPATGTVTQLAPLLQPRFRHTMLGLDDGRVLIVGGSNAAGVGPFGDVLEVEVYDPATGHSTVAGRIGPGRGLTAGPPVRLNDGRILIPGEPTGVERCGKYETDRQATYIFDPSGDRFVQGPDLPHFSRGVVGLADGRVVAFGSYLHFSADCASALEPIPTAWLAIFDPQSGTTFVSGDLVPGIGTLAVEASRTYGGGVLLADGRVMLIPDGGIGDTDDVDLLTVFR